eukprot:2005874-Rhodomonas_salina.1
MSRQHLSKPHTSSSSWAPTQGRRLIIEITEVLKPNSQYSREDRECREPCMLQYHYGNTTFQTNGQRSFPLLECQNCVRHSVRFGTLFNKCSGTPVRSTGITIANTTAGSTSSTTSSSRTGLQP